MSAAANEEAAALRDLPNEMLTRQEKDYDKNEQDEVINVENNDEEEIYGCEKCNKTTFVTYFTLQVFIFYLFIYCTCIDEEY